MRPVVKATVPALKRPARYDWICVSEILLGVGLLSTKLPALPSVAEMALPALLYWVMTFMPGSEPLKLVTKELMPDCNVDAGWLLWERAKNEALEMPEPP